MILQFYFWSKPRAAAIMPNFLRFTDFFFWQLCESIFFKALGAPRLGECFERTIGVVSEKHHFNRGKQRRNQKKSPKNDRKMKNLWFRAMIISSTLEAKLLKQYFLKEFTSDLLLSKNSHLY